jgi:hypothetical protein
LQIFNQIEFVAIPSKEEGTQQIYIVPRTRKEQGILALEIRMIANLQRCHHTFDGKRNWSELLLDHVPAST